MSKVQVIALKQGGIKTLSQPVSNLAELREQFKAEGMLASVNSDVVTDESYELQEHDFVTFNEQVKGAAPKSTKPVVKKTTKKVTKKAIRKARKVTKK